MEMLWFSSGEKIESILIEGPLGIDSLLVPYSYWDRLDSQEKKILPHRLTFLLRRYGKYLATKKRLHWKAGKIRYNRGVGGMKKMTIRVNTGAWAVLGALAAAHGVSRCYLFNYMLWLEFVPPNPNRLRLPGFVRENIPSPALTLITTNQHIQAKDLSILQEGEFIQIAS
ncbi:DUF1564 family protein [Leptospira yasudae]|uniref:DUF1564 family protein n=1 Tax=Leptospira yasudae TaxID=2202201 RepID=UPI00143857FC